MEKKLWWSLMVLVAAASCVVWGTTTLASEVVKDDTEVVVVAEQGDPHAPGEHHAMLKKMMGKFEGLMRVYPEPGADFQEYQAWSQGEMILNDRFLEVDYRSTLPPDLKFRGLGIYGYDDLKGEHTGVWIDNMTNGLAIFKGSCNAKGDIITTFAEYADPVSGELKKKKGVTHVQSFSQHVYFEYDQDAEGNWVKVMEVLFTRQDDLEKVFGSKKVKTPAEMRIKPPTEVLIKTKPQGEAGEVEDADDEEE